MLPVKRSISSLTWSSARCNALKLSRASGLRFYAEDSKSADASRNESYSRILRAVALDDKPAPAAQKDSDKELTDDLLGSSRRPFTPADPPRAPSYARSKRPPGKRIRPAPVISQLRSKDNERGARKEDASKQPEKADEYAKKASSIVGASETVDYPEYRLYVTARSKNCIMTLVDNENKFRGAVSAGMCGFRNAAEGSYEAGYQCAVRMFDLIRKIQEENIMLRLHIFLNGFGQGRSALLKALTMSEGEGVRDRVLKLTDRTPIKVGGVRLQKSRRL